MQLIMRFITPASICSCKVVDLALNMDLKVTPPTEAAMKLIGSFGCECSATAVWTCAGVAAHCGRDQRPRERRWFTVLDSAAYHGSAKASTRGIPVAGSTL